MREIDVNVITEQIRDLCIRANEILPGDVAGRMGACKAAEPWAPAKETLGRLLTNMEIAAAEQLPICQDTGMCCVFLEVGQDVRISGGDLYEAVHAGVRRGYAEGYLRKSIVGIRSGG